MTLRKTVCISIAIILGILFLILGILIVMFFSSLVDAFIRNELPLQKGKEPFELWRKPPVTPIMKVYFFNVTNAEEFIETGTKLKLQEVGPYVYSESWEKIVTKWHPNGTLSYRQVKNYTFEPSQSAGPESDLVILPNIPMLSAVSQMGTSVKIVKKALSTLFEILKLKPFTTVSVREALWGYDDPLIKLSAQILPEDQRIPFDKFGLFVGKNNTPSDVFTVLTGEEKLSDFAQIRVYKGQTSLGVWGSDECNELKGSDGTGFPAMMNENTTVHIYQPDFCRTMKLVVKNGTKIKHQGFETLRFQPSPDVFASAEQYPENQCYCSGDTCPRAGIFNVSACQFKAPIYLSWPHFLHGDPSLFDKIEGLNPNPDVHGFYIDIQPKLGLAMTAKVRMQINIQMKRVEQIPQTANLTDVLIPVLWFQDGINELPPKILSLIRQAINMPQVAEAALSYILFILGGLLCVFGVLFLIKSIVTKKDKKKSSGKPKMSDSKSANGMSKSASSKKGYENRYVEMNDGVKPPLGSVYDNGMVMENDIEKETQYSSRVDVTSHSVGTTEADSAHEN